MSDPWEGTMNKLVVTRHPALVQYLHEIGLVESDVPVLEHVNAEDIRGKHVIGVLPLHLAALAASVTEVPLTLTPEDRGQELSVDRLRQIAGEPVTYRVERVLDTRPASCTFCGTTENVYGYTLCTRCWPLHVSG